MQKTKKPHKIFTAQPQPQPQPKPQHNKKLGETGQSPKTTHHKLKLHDRMRIERYLENKSC